jgi:hypothetical protein
MSEARKIFIGTFPVGASELIGVDEAALKMIAEAHRTADIALQEDQRLRRQAIADAERAKKSARGMRSARVAMRLRKVLKVSRGYDHDANDRAFPSSHALPASADPSASPAR